MLLLQSVDDCSQSQYFCFSRHVVEVPSVRGMSAILTVTGSNPAEADEEIELVQIRLVAEEILWNVRMVIHILLHFKFSFFFSQKNLNTKIKNRK